MENEDINIRHEHKHWHHGRRHGFSSGVYGLAFLGALVYYLNQATSFSMGLIGVIKALFWPAVLIYRVFGMIGM